jgi:hypothetical protein
MREGYTTLTAILRTPDKRFADLPGPPAVRALAGAGHFARERGEPVARHAAAMLRRPKR